jgi:hypothetical protein
VDAAGQVELLEHGLQSVARGRAVGIFKQAMFAIKGYLPKSRAVARPSCGGLCECRGDKTAMELFIAGVRGWEAGLRRWLDDGKS